jgi:hypothetical protein
MTRMQGVEQHQPPFRSAALMRFAHAHLTPAPCALCGERPWVQLHHWGHDGGLARKPGDHVLVRLCGECARAHEVKWRALVRDERWDLFARFAADGFAILRAYVEHLERCAEGSGEATEGDPW